MKPAPRSESEIQNEILRECGRGDVRLFRNNVGQGWVGRSERVTADGLRSCHAGDVIVRAARPLHAGLCNGSSDLIGWRTVEITPEMVGQRIAVFAAIEVKTKRGTVDDDQQNFVDTVTRAGGIAAVARSADEAAAALHGADTAATR